MQNFLVRSALALAMGFSGMAFAPQTVSAQGLELEIGRDGPKLRLNERRCDPRRENCDEYAPRERWRENDEDRERYGDRRPSSRRSLCTEERALAKAERMGIRRPRIEDVSRRTIEVRGRNRYGERVYVTFGRAPNCPVFN